MLKRICDRCGKIMNNDVDNPNFNSIITAYIDRNDKIIDKYETYNLCGRCKNDFEIFLSSNYLENGEN